MSKRRLTKLALMVFALGAITLLQGCIGEDDDLMYNFMWAPSGSMSTPSTSTSTIQVGGTW